MKGLIRNNLYAAKDSIFISSAVCILLIIGVGVIGFYYPIKQDFILVALTGGLVGTFSGTALTGMQKLSASQWHKFELTMPVSRKNVIRAQYIGYVIHIAIGVLFAILCILVCYFITDELNMERAFFGVTFGLAFGIGLPAFMRPLSLVFGVDKSETLMLVAVIANLVLFSGSAAVCSILFPNENLNILFRVGYLIFSVVLFIGSYLISLWIYNKKDL